MPDPYRPARLLCAIAMLAIVWFCAPAVAQPAAPAGPAVVFAGRIAGDSKSARIFFDLDRKVDFDVFSMEGPDRIVIDSGPLLFRFADPAALEARGLVSFLRYGAIARDRSRIVLSLAAPAKIANLAVEEVENGKVWRLVFDLAATDPASFSAVVAADRDRVGRSGAVVTKGDRLRKEREAGDKPVVVIDPGHGGIDGGAKGRNGLQEKELTLAVALKAAAELEKAGKYEVMLTRKEDVFISLSERVGFARRNSADLVISLHADSLRQSSVRGASIYTLSREASDELAHELAQSENMVDIAAGLDGPAEDSAVNDILADLTARETSVFSRSFSGELVRLLRDEIALIKNPERSAAFAVLKAPEVPGVLIEMGYLSNPDDEKLLTDSAWQDAFAQLLARAVAKYFENHGSR